MFITVFIRFSQVRGPVLYFETSWFYIVRSC